MERAIAVWLGETLAGMTDPVAFIPALIVGFAASTWRARVVGGILVVAIVVAIKLPTIRKVAVVLDIPDEPLWSIALGYGWSIACLILASAGIKALFRVGSRAT